MADLSLLRLSILRRFSSLRSLIVLNLLDVADAPHVVLQSSLSKFSQIRVSCFRNRAPSGVLGVLRPAGNLEWLPLFGPGWALLNVTHMSAKGGYSVTKSA